MIEPKTDPMQALIDDLADHLVADYLTEQAARRKAEARPRTDRAELHQDREAA